MNIYSAPGAAPIPKSPRATAQVPKTQRRKQRLHGALDGAHFHETVVHAAGQHDQRQKKSANIGHVHATVRFCVHVRSHGDSYAYAQQEQPYEHENLPFTSGIVRTHGGDVPAVRTTRQSVIQSVELKEQKISV